MIITKNINFKKLIGWTGLPLLALIGFASVVTMLYHFNVIDFAMPWLPVSVVGTAVAFFVGFKNNQAYDRMWEARKIWGGIVNTSRAWGMYVDSFITDQFANKQYSPEEIGQVKRRLFYRHIGWLYTLRNQLLVPAPWEHSSQLGVTGRTARRYQKDFGVGLVDGHTTETELKHYLTSEEHDRLVKAANPATQIINEQSRDLAQVRRLGLIEDFRHMELEQLLYDFYEHQGKCERIKKFPLPRQFASMSQYFVGLFIVLLPFSLVPEMLKIGHWGIGASVFITALVGWVYIILEILGDYSENPFQGMANDIPMLSICRTIEIDLKEMLGETNLPQPIKANNDILM